MVRYWHHHGRTRFAKLPVKYAIAQVSEQLPKVTVAEFDRARQTRFMAALAEGGRKPATIARYMGVIQAALNRAKDHGEIVSFHEVLMPEAVQSVGVEPFSIDELRKVFAAARTENERMMVLLWTATACRPGAVLDLTWDRIDFETATVDFRVPGRRVTKKRRTRPPLAPSVAAYLRTKASVGYVVAWRTKAAVRPLKGFKVPFRRVLKRAEVSGSAYRIRKCVATWLRAKGVPEADVLGMLGHRFGGSETELYARAGYMHAARDAIETLIREVAPPWLPLLRDWQVESVKSLFSQRAANDYQ